MKIGTCALCLAEDIELQKSHILPKWFFKRAYGPSKGNSNPNPVYVTGGKAFQTSQQPTEELLCVQCEQAFARYEDFAARLLPKGKGTAALVEKLPAGSERKVSELRRVALPERFDLENLLCFGLSLLWRFHTSRRYPGCDLGPYGEHLRRFLHGRRPLPLSVEVTLVVYEDRLGDAFDLEGIAGPPVCVKFKDYRIYWFIFCGLEFQTSVGKGVPVEEARASLAHGNHDIILAPPSLANYKLRRGISLARPSQALADATQRRKDVRAQRPL